MSEEKLRNCPFCGGTNLYITDSYQGSPFFYNVICKGCGIRWISLDKRFLNTSPIEDELQKRIAELERFVERLIEAGESEDSPMPADWLVLVKDWKEREK